MKNLILFVFAILIFTSCAYRDVEVMGVESVNVDEFTTDNVQITASIILKNPNNFKIKIKRSELDLYVNGDQIGTTKLKKKIVLPKNTEMAHDFIIESSIKDLGGGLLSSVGSVISGGGVRVGVKGDVKGSAFLITTKIPIDVEENVSLDGGLFGF